MTLRAEAELVAKHLQGEAAGQLASGPADNNNIITTPANSCMGKHNRIK